MIEALPAARGLKGAGPTQYLEIENECQYRASDVRGLGSLVS